MPTLNLSDPQWAAAVAAAAAALATLFAAVATMRTSSLMKAQVREMQNATARTTRLMEAQVREMQNSQLDLVKPYVRVTRVWRCRTSADHRAFEVLAVRCRNAGMGPALRLRAHLSDNTGFESVNHVYPLVLSITHTRRPYEIVVGVRTPLSSPDPKEIRLRLEYRDLHDRLFTTEVTLTQIDARIPFDGEETINGPLAEAEEGGSSRVSTPSKTTLETVGVSFSRRGRLLHKETGTPLLAAIPLEKGDKPLPVEEDPTLESESIQVVEQEA